jgi:hypothetical protein
MSVSTTSTRTVGVAPFVVDVGAGPTITSTNLNARNLVYTVPSVGFAADVLISITNSGAATGWVTFGLNAATHDEGITFNIDVSSLEGRTWLFTGLRPGDELYAMKENVATTLRTYYFTRSYL